MYDTYDSRWDELAEKLLTHSVGVGPGDKVLILMRELETYPLTAGLSRGAVKRGAHPQILFTSVFLEQDLLRYGSDGLISQLPALQEYGMEWADVCIDLRGGRNLYEFDGIGPDKVTLFRKSQGVISGMRTEKTRWVIVRVPTEALAQQAHKSVRGLMDFFFDAVLLDWEQESKTYNALRNRFEGTKEVRILGRETDLRFSTEGRSFVVEDGRINMPGGEVYTSPVEDSGNGYISFEHPGVYAGELIPGIRLTLEKGLVTEAKAAENQEMLDRILSMDEGARRVGELGFGTNPRVTFFCNDILYDEKIFGTVHIALGRSYSQCGGKNYSALHWDIIKDLRREGEVYCDGKLVFKNGAFLT